MSMYFNKIASSNNGCGDVNFEEVASLVKAITPVPGGVGAVTTSILASHVIKAAEKYLYNIYTFY